MDACVLASELESGSCVKWMEVYGLKGIVKRAVFDLSLLILDISVKPELVAQLVEQRTFNP